MPPIENNNASPMKSVWSLIVVVILCVAVYYLYSAGYIMTKKQPETLLDTSTTETSLGGEIYKNSSNPLDGALPETTTTVVNPLEESYKNPFQ